MGDLSVTRLAEDRFWVIGSYYLQEWHQRWFTENLVAGVTIANLSDAWLGFAVSDLGHVKLSQLWPARICRLSGSWTPALSMTCSSRVCHLPVNSGTS